MSLLVVSYGLRYCAMSMAQAWHSQQVGVAQGAQGAVAKLWRASRYEQKSVEVLDARGVRRKPFRVIQAAPDAKWERFAPFDLYKSTSKMREVEPAPHVTFMTLKGLMGKRSERSYTALEVFATTYGLLGLFEEDFSPRPSYLRDPTGCAG
jgi:hypothetical protein